MKNIIIIFLFYFSQNVYGQKAAYIEIAPPKINIEKSIFSHVEVIDTRFDTVYMGFVQKGAFNRKSPIRLNRSMAPEITESALGLIEGAAKGNGTLLINIRNFFLSESTGAFSESGTFIFKAGCYYKEGDRYHHLFSVDTTIVVRSGWDVTKKLLNTANDQFGQLVKKAAEFDINTIDQEVSYAYNDILFINETEKKSIPVYNVDLPESGLYISFQDFKNNIPTSTAFIKEWNKKTDKPVLFEMKKDSSKGKQIPYKNYYAVCSGGELLISTEYGIYPVTKKNNDFYFVGIGKEAANTSDVAVATLMFGILGNLIAAVPEKATFEFKIDHTNGKFLPIRKISDN